MAIERLKFRCYRCNQLLAVAPSKAGTIVSCPKCQADLLIPSPEPRAKEAEESLTRAEVERLRKVEPPAESRTRSEAAALLGVRPAPAKAASNPSFLGELAGAIPPDLADLRPEDLRVEAEFFQNLTREPPPPVVEPAPWPVPGSLGAPFATESLFPPAPASIETASPSESESEPGPSQSLSLTTETVDRGLAPPEKPPPREQSSAVVPPIEIEPASILPPGTELRRVSEVVLPAPVVLAWSLFVLAGIAMSFVAGLLIGHFLWKMH
jgi:phage FluMu protein Com